MACFGIARLSASACDGRARTKHYRHPNSTMSAPGSVRSGEQSQYTPLTSGGPPSPTPKKKRARIFRWEGIIPLALGLGLVFVVWMLFAGRFIRDTITEAGTKALGTQLDIAELKVHPLSAS